MSQPQTASRSVQPFLYTPHQSLPMLFQWSGQPQNCPFLLGDLDENNIAAEITLAATSALEHASSKS